MHFCLKFFAINVKNFLGIQYTLLLMVIFFCPVSALAEKCTEEREREVIQKSFAVLNVIRTNFREKRVDKEINEFKSYVAECDLDIAQFGLETRIFDFWISNSPKEPPLAPPFDVTPVTDQEMDFDHLKILDPFSDSLSIYPIETANTGEGSNWILSREMNYFNGIEIPHGITELPTPAVFVGDRKCHFSIPITGDPTSKLEDGDILIYFDPHVEVQARFLYRNAVRGMTHVAVAVRDKDGEMIHVDSPKGSSGKEFRGENFHVIRLRKFPPEIKSNEDLQEWLKDPEKREKLREHQTERKRKIAMIRYYTLKLHDQEYSYDSDFSNEIDSDQESIRRFLENGEQIEGLGLYCSELALTSYALAGISRPAKRGLVDVFDSLKHYFQNVERYEGLTRPKAIKKGLLEMAVEYSGSDIEILRGLVRLLISPKQLKSLGGNAKQIQDLLSMSAEEAAKKIDEMPWEIRKYVSGEVIGPADYFASIFDPNSEYSYVGTHLDDFRPFQRRRFREDGRQVFRNVALTTDRKEICTPLLKIEDTERVDRGNRTQRRLRRKQRTQQTLRNIYQGN